MAGFQLTLYGRIWVTPKGFAVSVIFWPPCLGSADDSSSTCGGHVATEGLGWIKG